VSTNNEFLTLGEAARRIGLSGPAMRRRVHAGDLAVYSNPVDGRERLIRLADLAAYLEPKPTAPRRGHAGGIGTEPRPP